MSEEINRMMKHLASAKELNKDDYQKNSGVRRYTGRDSAKQLDRSSPPDTIPEPLPELYLAPASKKNSSPAFDRFSATVLNSVQLDEPVVINNQLVSRFWGFQPGGQSQNAWRQIRDGSYILFYTGWGLYTLGVRIAGRVHDPELSKKLWPDYADTSGGTDNDAPNPQPYEYIICLADPFPIHIPTEEIHPHFGWEIRHLIGFTKVEPDGIQSLRQEYGSVREFLKKYAR